MKRTKLTALLVAAAISILSATAMAGKTPVRFRFGVDWGFCPQLYYAYSNTYYTKIGYRVSNEDSGSQWFSNGYMTLNAGVEFLGHAALYAKSGYMGLYEDYRCMPLMLEAQWFFKGYYEMDSPFLMVYGGTALHEYSFDDSTSLVGFGIGYRHTLSHKTSIDLVARVQGSGCTPRPWDEYDGLIARSSIVHSERGQIAAGIGLSLNF